MRISSEYPAFFQRADRKPGLYPPDAFSIHSSYAQDKRRKQPGETPARKAAFAGVIFVLGFRGSYFVPERIP